MKTIKVLAGSLAAITAGATLALGIFAAPITSLGDYVKVSGNALNSPVIVIGDGATAASGFAQDVVGAADIAAAVAGYATTSVSTGAAGMGVSDGAEIGTTNTKLYLGDTLSKSGVKSTLTKSDLPTLLGSGSLTDSAGTTYNYDQYLTLQSGGSWVIYGNSGGDLTDPDYMLNLSTTAGAPGVINYSVTFNKLLNISSTNVQNKKLKLLGVDYTIGSTSTFDAAGGYKLILYGSSLTQTMSGGEEKKVTVGGVEYTVKVLGASAATSAAISINGESQTVTKGSSYSISGLPVYVEDVFWLSSTDQTQNSVKLSFGTNKLTLTNGTYVTKGTGDGTTVDGTLVSLTGTPNNGISKLEIAMAAKDNSKDYAQQGAANAFVDPVFGYFKIALGGLSGGTTEKLTVDNSGTTAATLKFADYRGSEKTLTYAYTSSTSFAPDLNSTSTATYVVIENNTVKKSDYVLLSPSFESEFSHVMQYTSSSTLGSSGAYIELKDAMSDTTSKFYLTNAGYTTGTMYIDGQPYYTALVDTTGTGSMSFTWGSTAAVNNPGSVLTVYPLVKTSKGGWITLVPGSMGALSSFSIPGTAGNTTLELPGGAGSATTVRVDHLGAGGFDGVMCGTTYNITTANSSGVMCDDGRLTWNITVKSGTTNNTYVNLFRGSTQAINASYPVVVFKEEKAKDSTNTDVQDFILTPITAGSGSTAAVTVSTPVFTTGTKHSQGLQSDTSVTNYVDRRGTFVKSDTDSQGLVEITYPDEQAVATVAIGDNPAFGAGTAGTVQQAIKITSPIGKLASEVVNNPAPGADLILVGGPCANSLVAKLLASSNVTCDNWAYTTGIIKEVTGGFTDGSRALIVAGTLAKDTRELAKMLIQGTLTYAV